MTTTKLITILAMLTLSACAPNDGRNGLNGANGQDGSDGQPAFQDVQQVTVSSVRTYGSGGTITDGLATLPAGIVNLPLVINVTSGNAGNGWLTILIDDVRFCYQGSAANATQTSGQFVYKGIKIGSNCDTGGAQPFANTITLFEETQVLVAVLGGGCSSLCATTAVNVTLEVKRF